MSCVSCKIIKDLLPLYYDNICSSQSRKMVEEHLAGCSHCQQELNRIKEEIPGSPETVTQNFQESKGLKTLAGLWKQTKAKAFGKGIAWTVVVMGLGLLLYLGLFQWQVVNVPMEAVKIHKVCQLADNRIAYHVEITDGYGLRQCLFSMDQQGNYYVSPKRPVFPPKATGIGLHNTYYCFDPLRDGRNAQERYNSKTEIKALYFGTPEDHILIWKKGMALPAASPEVEALLEDKSL